MSQKKSSVEQDARLRAADTLLDGKPILDKALLVRCAETIEALRAAMEEIADQAQSRGGIWARKRAEQALDPEG
jgi:hypothetical protein